MRPITNSLTFTLAVLAILCTTTLSLAQQNAPACTCAAADASPTTLSVSAQGQIEIDPDRAVVRVGVVKEAKDARTAMSQINERLDKARKLIKALNIRGTQLTTSNISIYPIYDNSRETRPRRQIGETTIIGYRASNTLSVRIDDITRTGEVIDEAVKAGVNQMQGVSFTSRDPFEAQTRALAHATLRAKMKANIMAGAMGAKIKRVVAASESGTRFPQTIQRALGGMESLSLAPAPTPVEPGSLTITASVSITYELSFEKD